MEHSVITKIHPSQKQIPKIDRIRNITKLAREKEELRKKEKLRQKEIIEEELRKKEEIRQKEIIDEEIANISNLIEEAASKGFTYLRHDYKSWTKQLRYNKQSLYILFDAFKKEGYKVDDDEHYVDTDYIEISWD